jgi:hypothetical protein
MALRRSIDSSTPFYNDAGYCALRVYTWLCPFRYIGLLVYSLTFVFHFLLSTARVAYRRIVRSMMNHECESTWEKRPRLLLEYCMEELKKIMTTSTITSSGILRRVALERTYVSQELSASFIRVTGIHELGTTLAVTSNRRTLRSRLLVTASVVPSL